MKISIIFCFLFALLVCVFADGGNHDRHTRQLNGVDSAVGSTGDGVGTAAGSAGEGAGDATGSAGSGAGTATGEVGEGGGDTVGAPANAAPTRR